MKKLVAYFSASGVTRKATERLAAAIGADLFEIRPAEPYTQADLDWTDRKSRSSREMSDPSARPAVAGHLATIADYEEIYIGFPTWWYVAPWVIDTFVKSYDFSGKTLIPFATSGGRGMGKTLAELKKLCPAANWKEGRVVNGLSEKELAAWANR